MSIKIGSYNRCFDIDYHYECVYNVKDISNRKDRDYAAE